MKKKDGGLIRNWQLHTLCDIETAKKHRPDLDLKTDMAYMFSGTVVEDPTGRRQPGHHMRSSLIVDIDRENGIIETLNTIYHVKDEGGDVLPDLGPNIGKIFY